MHCIRVLLATAFAAAVLSSAQVTEPPRLFTWSQAFGVGGTQTVEEAISGGTSTSAASNPYCDVVSTARFGVLTSENRVDPPVQPQYYGSATHGTGRSEWWDRLTIDNPLWTGMDARITYRISINTTLVAQGSSPANYNIANYAEVDLRGGNAVYTYRVLGDGTTEGGDFTNRVLEITESFRFGQEFDWQLKLLTRTMCWGDIPGLAQVSVPAINYLGIKSITDGLGNPISGSTISSLSGTDWTQSYYDPGVATPIQIASQNPNTGVPITVWNTDQNGLKNGNTSFTRTYLTGSNASFTAPQTAGSNRFKQWNKDGAFMSSAKTVTLPIDGPHTLTAIFAPTGTITFESLNPSTGVPITVYTADVNGATNGSTNFVRTYFQGTNVSCTAPAVLGSQYFLRWDLNGNPWQGTKTVTLTSGLFNKTIRAVYATGAVLTVQSNQQAVPITVWNPDKANLKNGTTTFTRVYGVGQTASLTAPATAGGKPFVRWEVDGVPTGTAKTITLTMSANKTANAIYGP